MGLPPPLPPLLDTLPNPSRTAAPPKPSPEPPAVESSGPHGSMLVELAIFNGYPFKDHWAYFVRSRDDADVGVMMHAAGDVRTGFTFSIQRGHSFGATGDRAMKRIPLQWIDARFLDEAAMLGRGGPETDGTPVCPFEASAAKIKVPEKSLSSIIDTVSARNPIWLRCPSELPQSLPLIRSPNQPATGKRVAQRDCLAWMVESASQLVQDGIFALEVATYLEEVRQ